MTIFPSESWVKKISFSWSSATQVASPLSLLPAATLVWDFGQLLDWTLGPRCAITLKPSESCVNNISVSLRGPCRTPFCGFASIHLFWELRGAFPSGLRGALVLGNAAEDDRGWFSRLPPSCDIQGVEAGVLCVEVLPSAPSPNPTSLSRLSHITLPVHSCLALGVSCVRVRTSRSSESWVTQSIWSGSARCWRYCGLLARKSDV